MALYRSGAFTEDDWLFPEAASPLPAEGKVAVGKAQLLAEWPALAQRGAVGLVLRPGEKLDGLKEAIPHLTLIVVEVAKYSDGRHFSTARLLRDRYRYRGELRARGDVLRDQIGFLARSGFDAFETEHADTIAALREHRIVGVHHHYQPASDLRAIVPRGRPWLRQTEGP